MTPVLMELMEGKSLQSNMNEWVERMRPWIRRVWLLRGCEQPRASDDSKHREVEPKHKVRGRQGPGDTLHLAWTSDPRTVGCIVLGTRELMLREVSRLNQRPSTYRAVPVKSTFWTPSLCSLGLISFSLRNSPVGGTTKRNIVWCFKKFGYTYINIWFF